MQINQRYFVDKNDDTAKKSLYKCTQCPSGMMLPVIEEGEAEYTEHFSCDSCEHHDIIPTLVIIISQMLSSLIGLTICVHLALNHLSQLSNLEELEYLIVVQQAALVLISCAFLSGFVYIMYQSFSGAIHRHNYTQGNLAKPQ